jgi:hypothetical protein
LWTTPGPPMTPTMLRRFRRSHRNPVFPAAVQLVLGTGAGSADAEDPAPRSPSAAKTVPGGRCSPSPPTPSRISLAGWPTTGQPTMADPRRLRPPWCWTSTSASARRRWRRPPRLVPVGSGDPGGPFVRICRVTGGDDVAERARRGGPGGPR